jgi:predicted SAM-dependent methyltransferase
MKKLNLGCGRDIKKGFDNVDLQPEAPIVWDCNKLPYKFAEENTYDYVYIKHTLEHLCFPEKVLSELWRICKPNAIIEISVPYYNNKGAYSDMEHKHYFSDTTFKIFVNEVCVINKKHRFEIVEMKLTPTWIGKLMPRYIREKLNLFVGGLIADVEVKLKVLK